MRVALRMMRSQISGGRRGVAADVDMSRANAEWSMDCFAFACFRRRRRLRRVFSGSTKRVEKRKEIREEIRTLIYENNDGVSY